MIFLICRGCATGPGAGALRRRRGRPRGRRARRRVASPLRAHHHRDGSRAVLAARVPSRRARQKLVPRVFAQPARGAVLAAECPGGGPPAQARRVARLLQRRNVNPKSQRRWIQIWFFFYLVVQIYRCT